jgi:hypothetical protein
MNVAILDLFMSCLFPDAGVAVVLWSGCVTDCRCWFVTLYCLETLETLVFLSFCMRKHQNIVIGDLEYGF